MKVRSIRRLIAGATGLAVATILLVAPVLVASAVARSTRLPGRLAPVVAVVKVPEPREAGTLVTRAVARVDVPAAGYRGGPTRRSVDAAGQLRSGEAARAQAILGGLIADHPILGKHGRWGRTRVTVGATPGGEQAVAYYATGRIVVDPRHAASLERILTHEAWHVIDYRDNGRIDWGEQVPPR